MNTDHVDQVVQRARHKDLAPKWILQCTERPGAKTNLVNLYNYFHGRPILDPRDPALTLDCEHTHLVLRTREHAFILATGAGVVYGADQKPWPIENMKLWPWGFRNRWASLDKSILHLIACHLVPVDIVRAAGTCRRWHWALDDERVWAWLFHKLGNAGIIRGMPITRPFERPIARLVATRILRKDPSNYPSFCELYIQPVEYFRDRAHAADRYSARWDPEEQWIELSLKKDTSVCLVIPHWNCFAGYNALMRGNPRDPALENARTIVKRALEKTDDN